MSAHIAIVGTETCGKTVFTTCLAKHYERPSPEGWSLLAQDFQTKKFVAEAWATLRSGEWLDPTPSGSHFQYGWKLMESGREKFALKLVDAPGHDIRALFATGAINSDGLPESGIPLARYCQEADIVLYLVNLQDYEGANAGRLFENEWAPTETLRFILSGKHKRCAIVLTQMDRYHQFVHESGGIDAILNQKLPQVYAEFVQPGKVPVFSVAAVDTTVDVVRNGQAGSVPAPDFQSVGLENVMKWVVASHLQVAHGKAVAAADAEVERCCAELQAAELNFAQAKKQVGARKPMMAAVITAATVASIGFLTMRDRIVVPPVIHPTERYDPVVVADVKKVQIDDNSITWQIDRSLIGTDDVTIINSSGHLLFNFSATLTANDGEKTTVRCDSFYPGSKEWKNALNFHNNDGSMSHTYVTPYSVAIVNKSDWPAKNVICKCVRGKELYDLGPKEHLLVGGDWEDDSAKSWIGVQFKCDPYIIPEYVETPGHETAAPRWGSIRFLVGLSSITVGIIAWIVSFAKTTKSARSALDAAHQALSRAKSKVPSTLSHA